jgi:LacI family transcriptional regulator
MSMITQSQLAKELGVSQQAVSFALNGTGTLAEATRTRILEGAAALGYRKNMASLTMQTGKTRSVGLLVRGHARSRMPQPLIMGMTTWLDGKDHTLQIVPIAEAQMEREEAPPLVFREHRVDGCVVLVSRNEQRKLPELLEETRMPAVWINEKFPHNAVYPDDVFLGQRGAEILMERGCKRVAYVGPNHADVHYSQEDRRKGYAKAVKKAGRPLICLEPGEAGVMALMRGKDRPDGILCYGAGDAEVAYVCARLLGVKVPEELKILTIGDAGASIGGVRLAVFRIPLYQVGIKVMEMLEKRMDGDDADVKSVAVRHEQLDVGAMV